ncbi:MAG: hypothetical protein JWO74_1584 [Solirubrobacterales bacterium]|nr:hypothetical protein [Solirubrobacterales bacterium]
MRGVDPGADTCVDVVERMHDADQGAVGVENRPVGARFQVDQAKSLQTFCTALVRTVAHRSSLGAPCSSTSSRSAASRQSSRGW